MCVNLNRAIAAQFRADLCILPNEMRPSDIRLQTCLDLSTCGGTKHAMRGRHPSVSPEQNAKLWRIRADLPGIGIMMPQRDDTDHFILPAGQSVSTASVATLLGRYDSHFRLTKRRLDASHFVSATIFDKPGITWRRGTDSSISHKDTKHIQHRRRKSLDAQLEPKCAAPGRRNSTVTPTHLLRRS